MDYKEALSQIINFDPPKKFEKGFISGFRYQCQKLYPTFYPEYDVYRISHGIHISCRGYDDPGGHYTWVTVDEDCPIYVKYDEFGDGLGDGFHILNGEYKGWYIYDEDDHYGYRSNENVTIDQSIDKEAFRLLSNKAGIEARIKEIENILGELAIDHATDDELEEELDALNEWLEISEDIDLGEEGNV